MIQDSRAETPDPRPEVTVGNCICCQDRDPDYEQGYLCCRRCWGRAAAALRQIPDLLAELASLGYVERDNRPLRCSAHGCERLPSLAGYVRRDSKAWPSLPYCDPHAASLIVAADAAGGRWVTTREFDDWAPADPVAHRVSAGPVNGASSAPRVSGSAVPPVPIRIDPTDLLAPARRGSLAVADRSPWPADQIGYLPVATELEFWVTDWAILRGEHLPPPDVASLAGWLRDRLGWACTDHPALDEFTAKLGSIHGALTAATGTGTPRPETLTAPCPGCGMLTLYRDVDAERIACAGDCPLLMTSDDYARYVQTLIKEAA